MKLNHEEIIFCLNCCNEILRGYKLGTDFETIFGTNGEKQIEDIEKKFLISKDNVDSAELSKIISTNEGVTVVKMLVITIHELDWELPLRTNLNKIDAGNIVSKFSNYISTPENF